MVMKKRGELTSAQIIGIVLVLAGAIVIAVALFVLLDTEGQDQRELCRLSVVTRATAGSFAQSNIPLACVADKICFTTKRGDNNCKQFVGEEGVRSIKLPSDRNQTIDKVLEESAFAMYDCWNMMGRGRMDLFGKAFKSYRVVESRCVVCSRLAIADDVNVKFPDIQEELGGDAFNEYLRVNNVPGSSQTYLNAFLESSGVDTYSTVEGGFAEAFEKDRKEASGEGGLGGDELKEVQREVENANETSFVKLSTDQIAFVFAQRKTKQGFWSGFTTGVKDSSIVIVGGGVTSGVAGMAIGSIGVLPSFILGAFAVSGTGLYAGATSYANQQASAVYCGILASGVEDKSLIEGCSVVRGVPYKAEYVNQICEHIEGKL